MPFHGSALNLLCHSALDNIDDMSDRAPTVRSRDPVFASEHLRGAGVGAAATTSGCGDAAGAGVEGEWRVEREQVGDTLVIRTLGGSVWRDTLQLAPGVAIGKLEGEDPNVLGNPGSVDMASDGRIYVADRQAREIRVFDPEGRHPFSFGREGGGPGESGMAVERIAEGAPVHPDEAEAQRTRITRNFRGVQPDWRWRGAEIPVLKPPHRELVPGADGSVWVRRRTRAEEEPSPDWDATSVRSGSRTATCPAAVGASPWRGFS